MRVCGLKTWEVKRELGGPYNELQNVCYTPSVIGVIKIKKMRLVGHVTPWKG
jgi:hypothetical protein